MSYNETSIKNFRTTVPLGPIPAPCPYAVSDTAKSRLQALPLLWGVWNGLLCDY